MRNILDENIKGKILIVRIDINSPIQDGKIVKNLRMERHAEAIKELSEMEAKIVLLAHQGRKNGVDFTKLKHHAKILSKIIGKMVKYLPMVSGPMVTNEIKGMNNGEILLLENVRGLDEETNKPQDAEYVKELSKVADMYVLDTLSVSHREHASVVGFLKYLPIYAGPTLINELSALEKLENGDSIVMILGGSKVNDIYSMLDTWLPKQQVKHILLGGKLGFEIDANLLEKKYGFDNAKKIILPVDGAVEVNGKRVEFKVGERSSSDFKDIGTKTINIFKDYKKSANYTLMNGPMGMYENILFKKGTCELLDSIANVNIFAIIGGGHTISAAQTCGINLDKFNYVSLSGKALIRFIEGKKLPGLKILGYYK